MIMPVALGGGILSLSLVAYRIPYDRVEGYLFFVKNFPLSSLRKATPILLDGCPAKLASGIGAIAVAM